MPVARKVWQPMAVSDWRRWPRLRTMYRHLETACAAQATRNRAHALFSMVAIRQHKLLRSNPRGDVSLPHGHSAQTHRRHLLAKRQIIMPRHHIPILDRSPAAPSSDDPGLGKNWIHVAASWLARKWRLFSLWLKAAGGSRCRCGTTCRRCCRDCLICRLNRPAD